MLHYLTSSASHSIDTSKIQIFLQKTNSQTEGKKEPQLQMKKQPSVDTSPYNSPPDYGGSIKYSNDAELFEVFTHPHPSKFFFISWKSLLGPKYINICTHVYILFCDLAAIISAGTTKRACHAREPSDLERSVLHQ
jgi:hypothetical protein